MESDTSTYFTGMCVLERLTDPDRLEVTRADERIMIAPEALTSEHIKIEVIIAGQVRYRIVGINPAGQYFLAERVDAS